jgi:hypothetical protein
MPSPGVTRTRTLACWQVRTQCDKTVTHTKASEVCVTAVGTKGPHEPKRWPAHIICWPPTGRQAGMQRNLWGLGLICLSTPKTHTVVDLKKAHLHRLTHKSWPAHIICWPANWQAGMQRELWGFGAHLPQHPKRHTVVDLKKANLHRLTCLQAHKNT